MTLSLKNPPGNPSSSIGINRDLMKIQTVTKNKLLKSDEGMDGTANFLKNPRPSIPYMGKKSTGGYGWYRNLKKNPDSSIMQNEKISGWKSIIFHRGGTDKKWNGPLYKNLCVYFIATIAITLGLGLIG